MSRAGRWCADNLLYAHAVGTDLLDLTTAQGSATGTLVESTRVPLLTVLGHPQARRIGEVAWLDALQAPGKVVALSRTEPLFGPPEGEPARPISSPMVSRRPVTLKRELAGWSIDPGECAGKVFVDGHPISSVVRIDDVALDAGVVLRLGRHAAFLWHRAVQREFGPTLGMIGRSPALESLRRRTRHLAAAAGGVLIRGETGTGKELVAAALHDESQREGPFVAVNLGAIPSALAPAELFGHARGAFTGAGDGRAGYFAQADGGTLFLDEVGDAPGDVQLALLRALETSTIQPLGASRPLSVDVRVVAATDAPIEERIVSGELRAPFFHRLATHVLHAPPLRERRDDIGRLLVHFLRLELDAIGEVGLLEPDARDARVWLSAKVLERLTLHDWPGNVRQLRNVARHLAGRAHDTGALRADDPELLRLLGGTVVAEPLRSTAAKRPRDISPDELERVLAGVDWQLGRAAEHLGISRAALNDRVDRHPTLKRAKFLTDAEIAAGREAAESSGQPLWQVLQVSRRGLARRLSSVDRA